VGVVREIASPSGSVTVIDATSGSVVRVGANANAVRHDVPLATLLDPVAAEPWEGTWVRVTDLRAWDATVGVGPFTVGDAAGTLAVTNAIYFVGEVTYGDTFDALSGVLDWHNDRFELLPINANSVESHLRYQTGADQLGAGDIVVTEWMLSPADGVGAAACGAAATSGQYVEILNTSGGPIDLDGLIVFDFGGNHFEQVRRSTPVAAGGRVVGFAAGSDNCYGLTAPFGHGVVISTASTASMGLYNHTAELDLVSAAGLPVASGVAVELTESNPTATRNDVAGNWCAATADMPGASTDRGTPGSVNDCP
jgi:hypothetical protein